MKLLAFFIFALIAQFYSTFGANTYTRNTHEFEVSSERLFSEEDLDFHNSQVKLLSELREALRDDLPPGLVQFQGSASRLPQAEPYKTKVLRRIQNLQIAPENKRKLVDLADQQLEKCKSVLDAELDKHCVGRLTGKMMQLIGAMENANRPLVSAKSNVNRLSATEAQRPQFYDPEEQL